MMKLRLLAACTLLLAALAHAGRREHFTLRYFAVRGLAEPIRLLLNDQDLDYTEIRYGNDPKVGIEPWLPAKKAGMESGLFPFGQVPSLTNEHKGGNVDVVQSRAIMNFLGRKYGLYGRKDDMKTDIMIGGIEDLQGKYRAAFPYGQDYDVAKALPKYLKEVAPLLGFLAELKKKNGGRHMTGVDLTIADYYAFSEFDRVLRASPTFLDAPELMPLKLFVKQFAFRKNVMRYVKGNGKTTRLPFVGAFDTEDAPGAGAKWIEDLYARGPGSKKKEL